MRVNFTTMLVSLAALLAAPLQAQPAPQPQALWDRTSVGMSQEQVTALYPAVVPDGPGNDIEATGASCLIKLDDQIVGEEHYSINFCFRDNRLISVALATADAARETRFNRRRDRLLSYLRARHGAPTRELSGGDAEPGVVITTWEQGCFQLYMIAASPDRERGMLVVSYNGNECPGSRAG